MPRYVILRHDPPPVSAHPLHWDLMLEHEGGLQTWALPSEPELDTEMVAEQLLVHRLMYLDYEGPISEDRGAVTRWDGGTYTVVSECGGLKIARLEGGRFLALVTLKQGPPASHSWRVSFSAAPIKGSTSVDF